MFWVKEVWTLLNVSYTYCCPCDCPLPVSYYGMCGALFNASFQFLSQSISIIRPKCQYEYLLINVQLE